MTIQEKIGGKRIILFSLLTFDYEKLITDKLRFFGAHVDFYDERPSNTLFTKGIIRIKRSFYQKQINKYYRKILNDISKIQYDFLFVITGEVIPEFFLKEFRLKNPMCYCVYYTWDSFANCSHPLSILNYFDKSFTFDSADALKYNINFRPLFFADQFGVLNNNNNNNIKYNLLFIGTAHSDRYKIANQIVNWCKSKNLTSFAYYYIQSKSVFIYKRIFDSSFKEINHTELNYKSLDFDSVLELYRMSLVVLDINHPLQTGLTMRTFEALGAEKKLITTNSAIKFYPFYNQNNILIIDRRNPIVNEQFFVTPFIPYVNSLKFSMSISGWVCDLFLSETKNNDWFSDNLSLYSN
jgi:hypothetical protein